MALIEFQQGCSATALPDWLRSLAARDGGGERLTGGRNNQGVFLHRLALPPGAGPSCVLEKRTRRIREARLHRRLQLWQEGQPDPTPGLLPQVYGVLCAGHDWRLFQAFVPHPALVPTDPREAGQLLARLAFDFHRVMAPVAAIDSSCAGPPSVQRLLGRQLRTLLRAGEGADPLVPATVTSLMDRLLGVLVSEPLVLAHNDLHWQNVRRVAEEAGGTHQLIDLGRVSWNLPGADLHGLVRQSLLGGAGAPVWPHAVDHYADLSGLSARSLRLAALWFTLVHCAGVWRQVRGRPNPHPCRREQRLIARLLSRLQAHLA